MRAALGHCTIHEVVRSGDVADGMERAGADELPLQALTGFARVLDEGLAKCRSALEIPAVICDGTCDLECMRVRRYLDSTLCVGLRRPEPRKAELHDCALDASVCGVVSIDGLGGEIERGCVIESIGGDATRSGQRRRSD